MPTDGPIVREKPLRPPGARRQLALSLFVLAALAGISAGAYMFLRPRPDIYTLRSYSAAKVGRKDLVDSLQVTGTVATRTEQSIAPQPGVLTQLLVSPGDLVTKGQLLAVVQPDGLEDEMASVQGSITAKRNELDKLLAEKKLDAEARAREEKRLETARDEAAAGVAYLQKFLSDSAAEDEPSGIGADLAAKLDERARMCKQKSLDDEKSAREEDRLAAARDAAAAACDKMRRLFEQGACTGEQLREAEEALEGAEKDLADARASAADADALFRLELKNYDRELADQARKALAQAETDLADARASAASAESTFSFNRKSIDLDMQLLEDQAAGIQRQLDQCRLLSPLSGQVLEVFADAGSFVNLHDKIAAIADLSEPTLQLDVPEDKIRAVAPGQQATITTGGRTYRGRVNRVGLQAVEGSGSSSTVRVEVVFLDRPDKVVPGGSATAEIITGVKENALFLPRGPYLTTGNQYYVYRIRGDVAEKVEVGFGLLNAAEVEILSGLEEGDEIITSGYQDFISYDRLQLQGKGGSAQ